MVYAPVIIPTLCRYEHFKMCIESLSNCKLADKTEVYIGLDYPAKQSHWPGYNKINEYLKDVSHLNFKNVHVIRRSRNYGFGPNGNSTCIIKDILEVYDRYIMSEDDNVFSPNFLVFVNKGLELFEDDNSVIAICGYKHFYEIKTDQNTFFRQNVDFSAWGYGTWKNRNEQWQMIDAKYFKSMFSLRTFFKVLKNGANRAIQFLEYIKLQNRPRITDEVLSVYSVLNNMNIVMPCVSLVKNMGFDGSGTNCFFREDLYKLHVNQVISDDIDFEYLGNGYEFYEDNRKIYRKSSYGKIPCKYFVIYLLKYVAKTFLLKK